MLASSTIAEAAAAAKVTERTGQKYMQDPAVKAALGQAMDDGLSKVARETVDAMTEALTTLREIHKDRNATDSSRVSAARCILDAGPKLREALDLADRVAALEEKILRGDK
jgi:hypothetical protein